MESLRTPEIEQHQFFVPSVSFLVKSPYVIFNISTSRSPVMVRFKIYFDVLKFVKRLCTASKIFHVTNVFIMTSEAF